MWTPGPPRKSRHWKIAEHLDIGSGDPRDISYIAKKGLIWKAMRSKKWQFVFATISSDINPFSSKPLYILDGTAIILFWGGGPISSESRHVTCTVDLAPATAGRLKAQVQTCATLSSACSHNRWHFRHKMSHHRLARLAGRRWRNYVLLNRFGSERASGAPLLEIFGTTHPRSRLLPWYASEH